MRAMDQETVDLLWKAILAKVEEIKAETPHKGYSRKQAYVCADGHSVATTADLSHDDGTHTVFWIEARAKQFRAGEFDITVARSFHSAEWFWDDLLAKDRSKAVVVEGRHYYIGDGNRSRESSGFSGRTFVIRFHDGREVMTRDLWYQGVIPPVFRDRMPDNAVFADTTGVSA